MSTPTLSEKSESSSRSRSRRERKMWKKTITVSRLPSFGFSGSDFATDEIPIIFSGYTAESEDSSSSELSDDSRTHSLSSDEHEKNIDQGRSESVRRRSNLKSVSRVSSMKVLRRQSTRLKKMRSMKRLASSTRHVLRKQKKKNLDPSLGLLEPHYLKPTSSSASKNVENIQKNHLGVARLKRIASLRYNGLLKATCSSAMKGSKMSNDVCNYRYCSIHGHLHSHEKGVTVPSLKRFVSMRRKFLKRQKSVNRRLVMLKRSLSRKRGSVAADQESKQEDEEDDGDGESNHEVFQEEEEGSTSKPNEKSSDVVMVKVDDNLDRGMESKLDTMDDLDGNIEKDLENNVAQCHGMFGEIGEEKAENVWNDKEPDPDSMDDAKDLNESNVTVGEVEETDSEETVEVGREDDRKNTEDVWNDTVALVKQAFDEILAEIADDDDDGISVRKNDSLDRELSKEDDGADSSDSTSSDMQPVKERDRFLSVIVSTSRMGEGEEAAVAHRKCPKKWSYLKRVILLKRFLKSLDRRERRKLSTSDDEESETMRLRKELVGERKNAEEWMLDHALRQVISTLDPSQKRKVKHLVKAFESLIPLNGGSRSSGDLGSPGREEIERLNSTTSLRDDKDNTNLQEVILRKDLEASIEVDASSSQYLGVEEELEGLASSSRPEREENEAENSPMILSEYIYTTDLVQVIPRKDLEETSEVSIAMKSYEEDESSSQHVAVEEELDGLASSSSSGREENETENLSTILSESKDNTSERQHLEVDASSSQDLAVEKTGDSERQNLSTWRNLIQKQMFTRENSEEEQNVDAAAVNSIQKAFETILSEIPDSTSDDEEEEEIASESIDQEGSTKKGWNSLRKVILLKRFVKSLENVKVFNPRKPRFLLGETALEAESVLLRHRGTMERGKYGEEVMLDYALRQAISRLAPIQRKKVEVLVQAFDTVLDGHESHKNKDEGTSKAEEVNKDKQSIENVFSRFQVHRKELKGGEEEVDSKAKESRNPPLPPIRNAKQRTGVEKEKDSRLWKLLYKHMVTEKEENDSTIEDDHEESVEIDARKSNTVTLVREALEKILSEIPDNSSDDQSVDSDITTDQELFERNSQVSEEANTNFKPKSSEKRVKGWNNVKKVVLLKRFVSDLGSMTKTPRFLPCETDQEPEKIHLRHLDIGGKKSSEEWMLDHALRQAISTLEPSQRRKVSLLAQAFDTISLQDIGSCSSTPSSATSSRNVSRQSSLSSSTVHEANAEIMRGKLMNLKESMEEKQQCSSLWRFLCKEMEDNERIKTSVEEEEESNEDGEKMEQAVELLGEVIDGISLEESQEQNIVTRHKTETSHVSLRTNRWSNLKRVILLRRFVKSLENVSRFKSRKRCFVPSNQSVEAERVNLRHQETQGKRNNDEWMVDNALQEVVSKLTPARKVKVQLLVQAFESLSASGN